jgi:hypothetical protein
LTKTKERDWHLPVHVERAHAHLVEKHLTRKAQKKEEKEKKKRARLHLPGI